MKEYVYFCKNCKRLEADTADNRPFRCEECGGKFQPLHVVKATDFCPITDGIACP